MIDNHYTYPKSYGNCLTDLIKQYKPNIVVEFGSGTGFTTLHLADGCIQNGFGEVHAHDMWESKQTDPFRVFNEQSFLSTIRSYPDHANIISYRILNYIDWLNSGTENITNFDLIYFDVNNNGSIILDIYEKLNIPENKNKVLLFEGGVGDRGWKHANSLSINDKLVQNITNHTIVYHDKPGIVQIIL